MCQTVPIAQIVDNMLNDIVKEVFTDIKKTKMEEKKLTKERKPK